MTQSAIGVIDDDWIKDTLSDDEIEIPAGLANMSTENADEFEFDGDSNEIESWTDLGLDRFANDATATVPPSLLASSSATDATVQQSQNPS